MNALELQFHRAMIGVYEDAKRETGYNATRFIQMVSERGGVASARQLVLATAPSDGFTALWERDRLDLTVEHLILNPAYMDLFTDDERAIAQDRLDSYQGGDR